MTRDKFVNINNNSLKEKISLRNSSPSIAQVGGLEQTSVVADDI